MSNFIRQHINYFSPDIYIYIPYGTIYALFVVVACVDISFPIVANSI